MAPRIAGAWQGGSLGPAWSWMMLAVAGASWGYRFGYWSSRRGRRLESTFGEEVRDGLPKLAICSKDFLGGDPS